MSVEIWPPIAPEALKLAAEAAQKRELDWLLQDLYGNLIDFKHGLEECYALLAPIDPGSTLVLSTPRNEIVKGYITRVGTRIVKGTIQLRLRTLHPQTLTIDSDHPIHLAPLASLHALLTHSVDLLGLTLSYAYPDDARSLSKKDHHQHAPCGSVYHAPHPSESPASPHFVVAQLRLLAQSLAEAEALLKGPPLTSADPAWTTRSAAPVHFFHPPSAPHGAQQQLASLFSIPHGGSNSNSGNNKNNQNNNPPSSANSGHGSSGSRIGAVGGGGYGAASPGSASAAAPAPPPLSFYLGLQDSSLVLWVRTLEAANAPVNFGTKLALAIGTARRLEHDEADRVFAFRCPRDATDEPESGHRGGGSGGGSGGGKATSTTSMPTLPKTAIASRASSGSLRRGQAPASNTNSNNSGIGSMVEVFVREKVRVETQDPSLLSLSAKLSALGHALSHARRNLAAVMGESIAGIDNDDGDDEDEPAVGS